MRFDVAMEEARRVHRRDRVTKVGADIHHLGGGERVTLLEELLQRTGR